MRGAPMVGLCEDEDGAILRPLLPGSAVPGRFAGRDDPALPPNRGDRLMLVRSAGGYTQNNTVNLQNSIRNGSRHHVYIYPPPCLASCQAAGVSNLPLGLMPRLML